MIWALMLVGSLTSATPEQSRLEAAAEKVRHTIQATDPVLRSRAPSRLVQNGCLVTIHPATSAGYIQSVNLASVDFATSDHAAVDGVDWQGSDKIGNAIILLRAGFVGAVTWRKPDQQASPFDFAVFETATYVRRIDLDRFVAILREELARCQN